MNNAEKFKQIFGLYATELWSMPESDFLAWLNRDVETTQIDHTADIGKKVSISCGQENDLISRQALYKYAQNQKDKSATPNDIMWFPSAQPELTQGLHNACTDAISRQATIDAIMGQPPEPHYPSWYAAQIEILPSAQPEIIRCKDCRFNDGTAYCLFHFRDVKGEGYCSWAERRTDG